MEDKKKDTSWYAETECKGCKKQFRAKRKTRWGEPRSFCSKKCISDLRLSPVKHTCLQCKSNFEVPLWQVNHNQQKKNPRKFCGKECQFKYWEIYGKSDSRNKEGKRHHHRSGYVYVHAPNHPSTKNKSYKYLLEHRVVMEAKLGRYLEKGENVHHLNGIRHDNRPENLELWVVGQPNGARHSDMKKEIEQLKEQIKQLKGEFLCM